MTQVAETLRDPTVAGAVLLVAAIAVVLVPAFAMVADLVLAISLLYLWWFSSNARSKRLPLRMPVEAGMPDPGDLDPGNGRPKRARGIMYLGNDRKTGEEIWANDSDARTHMLMLGTTGAGKSEALKSLITNALCWGSGFIFVDGKADTNLWASVFGLVRRFGREDDIRVLNYFKGAGDKGGVSNTLNPFAFGNSSGISELIVSLMAEAGSDPMWKEVAIALVKAVCPIGTWLRDNKGLLLDAGVFRQMMQLPEVIKLSRRTDIPEDLRLPLKAYLADLPGYADEIFDDEGNVKPPPPGKQAPDVSTIREQHNYRTMQLSRALGSLNDDYGHIFKIQFADIDMRDVVLNRRILLVMLPALDVSPDELANLGKIVVANLKAMMGSTLGGQIEGEVEEAINNKPTNGPSPFPTVFDEAGYYIVPGMDVMFAQARSLGFSLIIAGQDIPALRKRVQEAADSVIGNCNIQVWGKLTDPGATRELFEKSVGEAFFTESAGFSAQQGLVANPYYDRNDATVQRRLRAEWLDVRGQTEGQVHMTFGDRLIRAKVFYANPPAVKYLRVHRMLQVGAHTASKVDAAVLAESRELLKKARDPNWAAALAAPRAAVPAELRSMMAGFDLARRAGMDPLLCGGMALAVLDRPMQEKVTILRNALAEQEKALAPQDAPAEAPVAEGNPAPQGAAAAESPSPQAPSPSQDPVRSLPPLAQAPGERSSNPAPENGSAQETPHEATSGDEVVDAAAVFDLVDQSSARPGLAERIAVLLVDGLCVKPVTDWPPVSGGEAAERDEDTLIDAGEPWEVDAPEEVLAEEVKGGLEEIEVAAGATPEEARASVSEMAGELAQAQRYPVPPTPKQKQPDEVRDMLRQLKDAITAYKP